MGSPEPRRWDLGLKQALVGVSRDLRAAKSLGLLLRLFTAMIRWYVSGCCMCVWLGTALQTLVHTSGSSKGTVAVRTAWVMWPAC